MECAFEGCHREPLAKELCIGHYSQQKRGNELKPLRRYRRVMNGYKECSRCDRTKPISEFYTYEKDGRRSTSATCRSCHSVVVVAARARATNKIEVGQESTINKMEVRSDV